MKNKLTTVKEISKNYGLSYQTVNRYSDTGLLAVVLKKGNVRYYDRRQVEKRIIRISALASEGYSLMLIRKKLTGI
jgi:DNA-binding transcriptional MerR regulator